MSFPDFEDCEGCGSAKERPKIEFFAIPQCPEGLEDFDNTPCPKEGSFYSRLTKDFVLPAPGQVVKAYVCNGKLFAGCQWLGVCNINDATGKSAAFLRILSTAKNVLTVYNGCSSTNPIVDNPEVGTVFRSGTAIYPAPPRWCSAQFNKYISEAIANADGQVCAAILNCLNTSDEVCFASVPALVVGDDSEVTLFGGIIKGASVCLRKLTKIFTGSVGATLCFPEIPTLTDEPDIDGNFNALTYITPAGCLGKGDIVGKSCADENNFNPASQKINKIWVCAQVGDAVKQRLLVPTVAGQEITSYKDGSIFRWRFTGWQWEGSIVDTLIFDAAPSTWPRAALDLGATYANASAYKFFIRTLCQSAAGDNIDFILAINNHYVANGGHNDDDPTFQTPDGAQAEIPANPANPQVITFSGTAGPSGGTRNLKVYLCVQAWK